MNNVYLIYGEEDYLIKDNIKKIIGENEIVKYDLNETNISEVIEDLLMPSLFSDKKYIVCDNVLFLSSAKSDIDHNMEVFSQYLDHDNDNVLILVVPSKLDERKKIVKDVKKKVNLISCDKLNDEDLNLYVKKVFSSYQYEISNSGIRIFLRKVGNNLFNIHNEIDKLLLYKQTEKKIDDIDIDTITCKQKIGDIFDLVNAIVINNKKEAIDTYYELLRYNEEPIKIIVMLANEFRLIYQVKNLRNSGYNEKDMAELLEIHPYRIKLALEKGYRYDNDKLTSIIDALADLDIGIKRGILNKNMALETFILRL